MELERIRVFSSEKSSRAESGIGLTPPEVSITYFQSVSVPDLPRVTWRSLPNPGEGGGELTERREARTRGTRGGEVQ